MDIDDLEDVVELVEDPNISMLLQQVQKNYVPLPEQEISTGKTAVTPVINSTPLMDRTNTTINATRSVSNPKTDDVSSQLKENKTSPGTNECTFKTCDKKFKSQHSKKIHERKHFGNYPFSCDTCGKKFNSRVDLNYHANAHGEGPYKCKFCGFRPKSRTGMFSHQNTHTPTSHQCSKCGLAFTQELYLKRHVKTHDAVFPCSKCQKNFKSKKNLQTHQNVHMEKTLACDKCIFTTRHPYSFSRHMKSAHTDNNNTFLCSYCGIPYARKAYLFMHEKKCNAKYQQINNE